MMKRNMIIKPLLPLLAALFFLGCKVDTFKDVEGVEQKVSLVQSDGGSINLKPDNILVDKPNQIIRRSFGLALSGLKENEGFTADIQLDLNDVPQGYEKLTSSEAFLTQSQNSKQPITKVEVIQGSQQAAFYVNITKQALDAHAGKLVAMKINLLKTNKYTLNPRMQSVYILINTADFGTLRSNVTDTYFKNSVFARQAGTTARFVNLADWISNDAISKSRPTGAGYDQNVGYFGLERWASGDSPIINGKIYQTMTLPAGSYSIEVDMKKVAADKDSYFVLNEGTSLPGASDISKATAQKSITNDNNNKILTLDFKLSTQKQVSIGFLINIDQGIEKIIQASSIKMFKVDNLFD